jgi:hypothetical protein
LRRGIGKFCKIEFFALRSPEGKENTAKRRFFAIRRNLMGYLSCIISLNWKILYDIVLLPDEMRLFWNIADSIITYLTTKRSRKCLEEASAVAISFP